VFLLGDDVREPDPPTRRLYEAYGGWAVFRRPLFALDAVVAGRLAVGASVTVTVVLVAVTRSRALLQRKAELES